MGSSLVDARVEPPSRREALLAGWGRALRGSVVAAVAAAAAAEAAMLLLHWGKPLPGDSLGDAARHGWLLFYVFHHAGFEVISPAFHLPAGAEVVAGLPSGYDADITLAFAAMTGTLLVLWLLARAGRVTAQEAGGSVLMRGVHGAKVAVPYALLSYIPSWWLEFRLDLAGASPMSIHPSRLASMFWPLALALVAGFAGGIRSVGDGVWTSEWWETDRWNRRWRGAVAGGWRMAWVAGGLSLAALLGLAAARAGDASAFLGDVFSGGIVGGVAMVALTVLVLPNMALWVLVPAMGGCLEVGGSTSDPYCFLGYGSYPSHLTGGIPTNPAGFPNLGGAPAPFLLFLLVPVAAVLLGGVRAAERAEARSRGEAITVGAMAGAVFALLLAGVLVLASVRVLFNGPISYVATGLFQFGPSPVTGFGLALLWGTVGGGAGGWMGFPARRGRTPPVRVVGDIPGSVA